MTLAEARALKKGTPVKWREDGYYITGEFVTLRKYVTFGKMSFSDIATFEPNGGKQELRAVVKYVWENGRTYETSVSIRALKLADAY